MIPLKWNFVTLIIETEDCDPNCTLAECGDGYLNQTALEECDDGNTNNDDGCSSACLNEFCGDGNTNLGPDEECDSDGAGTGGETADCNFNCTLAVCGDNYRNEEGEECDDGNTTPGDGCDENCQLE
jgi:cysteine-rich repeat protein